MSSLYNLLYSIHVKRAALTKRPKGKKLYCHCNMYF